MANENNEQDNLQVASNEDVEFSIEQADRDDLEALARAEQADRRANEDGSAPM